MYTIPDDYNHVMPYLIVKDAVAFMDFIAHVLGGTEKMRHMRGDHTIMHAEMCIGHSVVMIAEATDEYKPCTAGLFVYVPDADASYQKALDAGAVSIMGMSDQSYGRTCGVLDTWGNTWWITSWKG